MILKLQRLAIGWHSVFRELSDGQPQTKLAEEVSEFLEAERRSTHKLEEAADVVIVVITQLTDEGFTVRDLMAAVAAKLSVNIRRTWKLNSDGSVSHVKGAELRKRIPLRLAFRLNHSLSTSHVLWGSVVGLFTLANVACVLFFLIGV